MTLYSFINGLLWLSFLTRLLVLTQIQPRLQNFLKIIKGNIKYDQWINYCSSISIIWNQLTYVTPWSSQRQERHKAIKTSAKFSPAQPKYYEEKWALSAKKIFAVVTVLPEKIARKVLLYTLFHRIYKKKTELRIIRVLRCVEKYFQE